VHYIPRFSTTYTDLKAMQRLVLSTFYTSLNSNYNISKSTVICTRSIYESIFQNYWADFVKGQNILGGNFDAIFFKVYKRTP